MKKGFTIIELLVAIGLFVIIIAIAVGGFTNVERTQRQVSSLIAAQSNVSLALEQMSREIRTGYLFCHDPGANNPSLRCGVSDTSDPFPYGTTCHVNPASSTWTCPSLDFRDAQGNEIKYSWAGGALTEVVNPTSTSQALSLTGDGVSVKYLQFQLYGQTEDDQWPPRITISLGISASSTDPAVMNDVFNLQTTVSARIIDCTTGSNSQC